MKNNRRKIVDLNNVGETKNSSHVFRKTLKEILGDSISESTNKIISSSNVTQFQPKILHKKCEAIFQERRMMYEILLNGKYIGYTNCNRMVFNTRVEAKEEKLSFVIGIQFSLVDLVTISEICEMCTKSLYR